MCMKVMILAAGRGTRMAPLTDHCPKPLIPLVDKPLIVHHLEKLAAAGFHDVVINHAYLGEQLEAQLQDGTQWNLRIQYSPEQTALETAGGIARALPLLMDSPTDNAPFLVINGDVWTDTDYRAFQAVPLEATTQAYVWLTANPEHNPEGDFVLTHDGLVQSKALTEATNHLEPCLTFSGISLLRPALFAKLPQGDKMQTPSPLAPLLRHAMQSQQVQGSQLAGDWVDVGTPQRLAELEQRLIQTKSTQDKTATL